MVKTRDTRGLSEILCWIESDGNHRASVAARPAPHPNAMQQEVAGGAGASGAGARAGGGGEKG